MGLREDMRARIIAATDATASNTYIARALDDPNIADLAVFILATGGFAPESTLGGANSNDLRTLTIQVIIRSSKEGEPAGYELALAVRDALHKQQTAAYLAWYAFEIFNMDRDDKRRNLWSFNVQVTEYV